MAELAIFGVSGATFGGTPIPNALRVGVDENETEGVKVSGDDKTFPIINRGVEWSPRVTVDAEDAVEFTKNTKASLVFVEKKVSGSLMTTCINMVYRGISYEARRRGGSGNARTYIFTHESADGVTAWKSST